MKDGYIKVASCTPDIRVADCEYNAANIIKSMKNAAAVGAKILVTPELCVSGYTCGDLLNQTILLDGAIDALLKIKEASENIELLTFIGLPIRHNGKLYNAAACVYCGEILGIVPKSNLPNYSEFYELRNFTPACGENSYINIDGIKYPFGTKILFSCENIPEFTVAAEICEDLWVVSPPSVEHCIAGATIIVNLSASDELIAKDEYRRNLVVGQSARLICGYVYADAGYGESTTDMVFAGHDMIAENGILLNETQLFTNGMTVSEIDVQKLSHERCKMNTYPQINDTGYMHIFFTMTLTETVLTRKVECLPFVPEEDLARKHRAETILLMQASGLKKRIEHTHCQTAVIGISGGLDSCLALLVSVRAMDMLERPRRDIIAVTMPCFGTTKRTHGNAEKLCDMLGVTLRTIDIEASVNLHFEDISHDKQAHDVVFENAQARERTQILMDIANQTNGIVVGTGDLSELALGWATYNGDHMSMYGVNASIPKTLVRHVVEYCAQRAEHQELASVLLDILATPVSPELLPADDEKITQCTEDIVGPYELHDFFLYYLIRFGFAPHKVLRLCEYAFGNTYDRKTMIYWLRTFVRRFFTQQFKRTCLPDGPKIGSVSLSPRGDWRMPSDAISALWLKDIDNVNL